MAVGSLFKYAHLGEHSAQLLSTPTIWFSSPSSLNDPFECRPWFTFERTDAQFLEIFRRIARGHFPNFTEPEVEEEARRLLAEDRNRDQTFLRTFRSQVVQMLGREIGLCCLSRRNDNILMWSHYAWDHQGFCLEFDATDQTPFFGEAQEVKYARSFPVVDFFNTPHDIQVDLIFLTKLAGWEYEEEYRIINHQQGAGLHAYPGHLLKSVTFGLRTPEADKDRIRGWLRQRETRVPLRQPPSMNATSRSS